MITQELNHRAKKKVHNKKTSLNATSAIYKESHISATKNYKFLYLEVWDLI